MKITLISLRTEESPSKFINNGSRQGERQALGQISKPGKWQELSKGLVLPGRRFFAMFQAGSGGCRRCWWAARGRGWLEGLAEHLGTL